MKVNSVAKAVVGGLAAGTAAAATAVQDGQLTLADGITIVGAVLASYGITWWVPNRPAQEDAK